MTAQPSPQEVFRAQGVPHRRLEDWKYTDLRQMLDADAVEGAGDLSLGMTVPEGVEAVDADSVKALPEWAVALGALGEGAMQAAASAFVRKLHAFRVARNVHVLRPLRLDVLSGGQGIVMILLEPGSSLSLVETGLCAGSFSNLSLSILLQAGARLDHFRETPFAADLVSVETVSVVQERDTRYRVRLLAGGARLSRTEFDLRLQDGAEANLSGVSLLGEGAHADITTRVEHAAPHTTSRQLFKKVAGGNARAIYQGKITVKEGAVQSDSRQTAKALLLGDRAEADLKPELEILADDVKCAHGAAIGDLDENAMFYLRSRGIPLEEARGLLVHAFLAEVVEEIEDEDARDRATRFIDAGLADLMGARA